MGAASSYSSCSTACYNGTTDEICQLAGSCVKIVHNWVMLSSDGTHYSLDPNFSGCYLFLIHKKILMVHLR